MTCHRAAGGAGRGKPATLLEWFRCDNGRLRLTGQLLRANRSIRQGKQKQKSSSNGSSKLELPNVDRSDARSHTTASTTSRNRSRFFSWLRSRLRSRRQSPSSQIDEDPALHSLAPPLKCPSSPSLQPPPDAPVQSHSPPLPPDRDPPAPAHVEQPPVQARRQLGLHVVYQPEETPVADIIFIHGLAGDSTLTWCKDGDEELFWPGQWLPLEPGMGDCRILSFGYDAGRERDAIESLYGVLDFAAALLQELEFGHDAHGEALGIGSAPVVLVAHSMGGLIAKATYLLGQSDDHYEGIIDAIKGMVFMATPHRGATELSNLLRATFHLPTDVVAEFKAGSPTIDDINKQFRYALAKLRVASFYETLPTTVGADEYLVLGKDSATLGYEEEYAMGLDADHNGVCKYASPDDSNYSSVRNALVALVTNLLPKANNNLVAAVETDDPATIEKFLCVPPTFRHDISFFLALWCKGTCSWILQSRAVREWLGMGNDLPVIHFRSPAASGKSVMCAYIAHHLRSTGCSVQYFFFETGDQNKRSVSVFLRAMAAQLAADEPAFRDALLDMIRSGFCLPSLSSVDVFTALFMVAGARVQFTRPLFWIVDAVDESESPRAVLGYLAKLQEALPSLRIFLTSQGAVDFAGQNMRIVTLPSAHMDATRAANFSDIMRYIGQRLGTRSGDIALKERVSDAILRRAQGNFLWVRLVLDEILACDTDKAVDQALQTLPKDLTEAYRRMELAILDSPNPEDKELAQRVLQWVLCARYSMTLDELLQALHMETVDLGEAITRICAHFVAVTPSGNVRLIHQSAREYVTRSAVSEVSVNLVHSHTLLFQSAVEALCSPELQWVNLAQQNLPSSDPFLIYAATSWTYHLQRSGNMDDAKLDLLSDFFRGPSVLVWIHILALAGQVGLLVKAAQDLLACVENARQTNVSSNQMFHRLADLEYLDGWSVDLVKIVSKFSQQLRTNPSAIYGLVAPFCPSNSVLHQQFHKGSSSDVMIFGLSERDWSDGLASTSLPRGEQGIKIGCSAQHVAVLGASGTAYLWDSNDFRQTCVLDHGETVTAMSFSRRGDKMLTFGLRTSKLWAIPSGQLLLAIESPTDRPALAMAFQQTDDSVLVVCTDRLIHHLDLAGSPAAWSIFSQELLQERFEIGGTPITPPNCVAFNWDATQLGVSYRGFPLSVWDLGEMRCMARCRRPTRPQAASSPKQSSWTAVDKFTWNPVAGHIIGLYKDGTVFKWHPMTRDYQEAPSTDSEIAASPDGRFFITSNSEGTVRVWSFDLFSVIYQLSSGDAIRELSFAPDSRRFYDIRGSSSLNLWQPNSLLHFHEIFASFTRTSGEDHGPAFISHVSEAHSASYEAVSVICTAGRGSTLYAVGNEGGRLTLFDTMLGKLGELMHFSHFTGFACLALSEDSAYIASADLAGEIEVGYLGSSPEPSAQYHPKPKPAIEKGISGVCQLLFNHDATLLLVVSELDAHICSVNEGTLESQRALVSGLRKWVNHPFDPDVLLSFGAEQVTAYHWTDFSETASWSYVFDEHSHTLADLTLTETLPYVKNAIVTQDGQNVLLQRTEAECEDSLLVIDLSALPSVNDHISLLPAKRVPGKVSAKANIPLSLRRGQDLVFLDDQLWVCTYALDGSEPDIQRHYFIPQGWASMESFRQCRMLEDSTLLSPRKDEVAVIISELGSAF